MIELGFISAARIGNWDTMKDFIGQMKNLGIDLKESSVKNTGIEKAVKNYGKALKNF